MAPKSPSVTLITGTSRGIGHYLAQHYLTRGHVVIGVSRSACDIASPNYHHFNFSITDEPNVRKMFIEIQKRFGYLTHLINNAGISSLNHALLTPLSTARRITDVNLLGPFLFCQEAARLMRPQKFGRIINFSTISVPLHSEGVAIYAASKAAVEELTRILAKELGPMGITVNCVGPSVIDTDLGRGIPQHRLEGLLAAQTNSQAATSEDVAHIVDFFISPQSHLISAQVIYLGGFC